jgi:hypothetical protein
MGAEIYFGEMTLFIKCGNRTAARAAYMVQGLILMTCTKMLGEMMGVEELLYECAASQSSGAHRCTQTCGHSTCHRIR